MADEGLTQVGRVSVWSSFRCCCQRCLAPGLWLVIQSMYGDTCSIAGDLLLGWRCLHGMFSRAMR